MPRERHKPEEVVAKPRQVDVLVAQGRTVADAVRSIGATEVTWRCFVERFWIQGQESQADRSPRGSGRPASPDALHLLRFPAEPFDRATPCHLTDPGHLDHLADFLALAEQDV